MAVKLTLAYDGTAYHGWQRQHRLRTVQGTLEDALQQIAGEPVVLYGAGRTDAGVHAEGQVAHFLSTRCLTPTDWTRALNALLPMDIAVRAAEGVPDTFHARFSAKEKQYLYRIHNGTIRDVHRQHLLWHIPKRLNVGRMRKAAAFLVGDHDFTSFCASGSLQKDTHVYLKAIVIQKRKDEITLTFTAQRFLWRMVRNLVGLLVKVGTGAVLPETLPAILDARDRRAAGPTAPAHGLYLLKVAYD